MADVTIRRLEEFESIYEGAFFRVRAGLGVRSFGISVQDLPPHFDAYPEHDHADDGQEEVFVVLRGLATLLVGDERHRLEPWTFARVGARERRKLMTGDEGARVLVIGGTPGGAYSPPRWTEEGAPEA